MKRIITAVIVCIYFFSFSQLINAEPKNNVDLVNINSADMGTISSLPGIGKKTAEKIILYREKHGTFMKKEELMHVKGIGARKFEKLKSLIVLSDENKTLPKNE